MSVCSSANYFLYYICNVGRSNAFGRHTESVFALSLQRNLTVSKREKTTNDTHFLFRLWQGRVLRTHIPYLSKCGVLHRLFSLGFCQNLVVDKRNQLHTSWLIMVLVGTGEHVSYCV